MKRKWRKRTPAQLTPRRYRKLIVGRIHRAYRSIWSGGTVYPEQPDQRITGFATLR